jgi:hypothetical protein
LRANVRSNAIDITDQLVSSAMLGWMIVTLACIGYFLNEALRAPVIEDGAEGSPEKSIDESSSSDSGSQAGSCDQRRPYVPDQ